MVIRGIVARRGQRGGDGRSSPEQGRAKVGPGQGMVRKIGVKGKYAGGLGDMAQERKINTGNTEDTEGTGEFTAD